MGLGHLSSAALLIALMAMGAPHSTDGGGSRPTSHARAIARAGQVQEGVGPRRGITCPAGSVVLRRARTIQRIVDARPEGTTFCFKSKTYFLKDGIVPKSRDSFIGRYGAILDGSRWRTNDPNVGAFSGSVRSSSDVTIRNLVIRKMPQHGIDAGYAVNSSWTIDHNEIHRARVGISIADRFRVTNNFIHRNRQFGFGAFRTTGFLFQNNVVARSAPCGCWSIAEGGGGSKLVQTTDAQVIGNYFHDNWNHDLHFDTGNTGVLIDGNRFVDSEDSSISMEQNKGAAIIRNNTIVVTSAAPNGILVSNSSNEQIYNNTVRFAGYAMAIRLWFDSSRIDPDTNLPFDTANNSVHDNTITLRGPAQYAAGINCTEGIDCSPFWTSKSNSFQANTYRVPTRTGMHWVLSSPEDWGAWKAVGFDTSGTIISP